jgi:hypothetical protein
VIVIYKYYLSICICQLTLKVCAITTSVSELLNSCVCDWFMLIICHSLSLNVYDESSDLCSLQARAPKCDAVNRQHSCEQCVGV